MGQQITPIAILLYAAFSCFGQLPQAGLVAHYPFNANTTDDSGHDNHAIAVVNASLTSDRCGNPEAAYFFNRNGYIELPANSFSVYNTYTYSFWMQPYSASKGMPFCIGESATGFCQAISFNPGNILFAGSYNNGTAPIQSYAKSDVIPLQFWIHVAVSRDTSMIKLYVNGHPMPPAGTAYTKGQSVGHGSNPPVRAVIGARSTFSPDNYWFGKIDDFRFYGKVLNELEIMALYHEPCVNAVGQQESGTAQRNVFPNPSRELLTLCGELPGTTVRICSTDGSCVYTAELVDRCDRISIKNIGLVPGIYMIQFARHNRHVKTIRLAVSE